MTGGPTIDYEALHQDAMRGIVRTVLMRTAKSGLPGDHHFYISFDTQAAGVVLSKRLKDKYPQEMTIVLQHRFWDLMASEERFEVKLTFEGIPERLVVPFTAIKVFFDPSVRYGLQFEDSEHGDGVPRGGLTEEGGEDGSGARPIVRKPRPQSRAKPRVDREGAAAGASEPRTTPLKSVPARNGSTATPPASSSGTESDRARPLDKLPAPAPAPAASASTHKPAAGEAKPVPVAPAPAPATAEPAPGNASGAQIVSLDAFRKK